MEEEDCDGLRRREVKDEVSPLIRVQDKEVEGKLKIRISQVPKSDNIYEETWLNVLREVSLPFLCAGLGMVGAGIVLDSVQYWKVFTQVPELFIIVPALIGLKGNLEMTLASRLSTHANLGYLDTMSQTWEMGAANLALIQVQGIVVGALASIIAMAMAWFPDPARASLPRALLMCASSVATASLASFILGVIMIVVVVGSRRYHVNPDNVATPIAASLGDLVTLALLSWVASALHISSWSLLPPAILAAYIGILPTCVRKARDNDHTREILYIGWTPVLSAMVISSMGGKILNKVINKFPDIAVFQPVINGVAGNLVGIQASRISTDLHKSSKLGELPKDLSTCNLLDPMSTFGIHCCRFSKALSNNSTAARVLLFLVAPGHLIFLAAIGISQGFGVITMLFVAIYIVATLLQVGSLLYIANIMVHYMWRKGINPDNSAIPYLTALGDLLGGSLLAGTFQLIDWID